MNSVMCGPFPKWVVFLLRPLFWFQNWNDRRIERKYLGR